MSIQKCFETYPEYNYFAEDESGRQFLFTHKPMMNDRHNCWALVDSEHRYTSLTDRGYRVLQYNSWELSLVAKKDLNPLYSPKPPLGVMPKDIWIEKRIQELSRAIHEYTNQGLNENIGEWINELRDLHFGKGFKI